jgi:hypothetical protein
MPHYLHRGFRQDGQVVVHRLPGVRRVGKDLIGWVVRSDAARAEEFTGLRGNR